MTFPSSREAAPGGAPARSARERGWPPPFLDPLPQGLEEGEDHEGGHHGVEVEELRPVAHPGHEPAIDGHEDEAQGGDHHDLSQELVQVEQPVAQEGLGQEEHEDGEGDGAQPLERVGRAEAGQHVERREAHRDAGPEEEVLEPRPLRACGSAEHLGPQDRDHPGEPEITYPATRNLAVLRWTRGVVATTSPPSEPASMLLRALRAGRRATPRNSRKKAMAEAGMRPPAATASRSDQAAPKASVQRRKKMARENRNRSAENSANRVNTRGRSLPQERGHRQGQGDDRGEECRLCPDVHSGEDP